MSATDIQSMVSMPNELNFQLPASLPAAKTFEIRVQPCNQQTFTPGQVIQFDLPCSKIGQYVDPSTTYIRFKVTYTHTGTAGTNFSYLLGSGYSYFNKYEVYGNNSVTLDTINEYGLLANTLLQTQLNGADKLGLTASMGFNQINNYNTLGHKIFDAATTVDYLTFEYALPLIGILGSGTDKLFPTGNV